MQELGEIRVFLLDMDGTINLGELYYRGPETSLII